MGRTPFANRHLHFVGIGGAGMSGLALVASELGAAVSGSDRAESSYTRRLRDRGLEPRIGHDVSNLPRGADVVVSTAIPEDNPELVAARDQGLTILHRGDLLGEVSRLRRCITVGGTHGKTTTAAMVAHSLRSCGRNPGFLIGGELRSADANAAWGDGDWTVLEADESDRSFLKLAREVAVVTNVELDHHATFRSLGELERAFAEFAGPGDERIQWHQVELPGLEPTLTYGIGEGDLAATEVELLPLGSRFQVDGIAVELEVPGSHNVLNALGALGACRAAGLALEEAGATLRSFAGAGRRFEDHGRTASGARVFDDYAHHPTEVDATLRAARTLGARRLVALFQPHLYSRTLELARRFGQALALADLVVVVDVYPARERAEDFPGTSGLLVAAAAAQAGGGKPVWWLPDLDEAIRRLEAELEEGDVLLTLGAGDVDRAARALTGPTPAPA